MKSLLQPENTYNTVGGYSVTVGNPITLVGQTVYPGLITVNDSYLAYFDEVGTCFMLDNSIKNELPNYSIELFDIVLTPSEIDYAYSLLKSKSSVKNTPTSPCCGREDAAPCCCEPEACESPEECCDEDCCESLPADAPYNSDVVDEMILDLRNSAKILHGNAMSAPNDKRVWVNYNMILSQLITWLSFRKNG